MLLRHQLAGQRAGAEEPRRAADRAHAGRHAPIDRGRSAGRRSAGRARARRSPPVAVAANASPRSLYPPDRRGAAVVLDGRSTGRSCRAISRATICARSSGLGLQQTSGSYRDAGRAVQHAAGRLQALPELPAEASVPHAVPAVPERPCGPRTAAGAGSACRVSLTPPPAAPSRSVCPDTGLTRYVAPIRRASSFSTGSSNPENTTTRTSGRTSRASSASCRPLNAPSRTSVTTMSGRRFAISRFASSNVLHGHDLKAAVGEETAQRTGAEEVIVYEERGRPRTHSCGFYITLSAQLCARPRSSTAMPVACWRATSRTLARPSARALGLTTMSYKNIRV